MASPNNCNIFVGGLHHGVTTEALHASFEAFCLQEEDEKQMKAHVVMDVSRNLSKGYGFVTLPCRRSAELAMICMQEFEIYGHCMQLGWGQGKRNGVLSNTEDSLGTKTGLKQCEKESLIRTLTRTKGNIVFDKVFTEREDLLPKTPYKRDCSRWDQETPRKSQKLERFDYAEGDPIQQGNKKHSYRMRFSEIRNPLSLHSKQFDSESVSLQGDQVNYEDGLIQNESNLTQTETRIAALRRQSEISHGICTGVIASGDEAISNNCSVEISLDVNNETPSTLPGIRQNPTYRKSLLENHKEIDDTGKDIRREYEVTCEKTRFNTDGHKKSVIQWLTHNQKVALLKSACSKLRSCGVRGHLGVFGVHYETDNSRVYVVCAKHVTEGQLLNEFKAFGTAEVKLVADVNGFSKGCAFIQYTDSACAERAIKQMHGKVVGGMPMKVMVAEPKLPKGSQRKSLLV